MMLAIAKEIDHSTQSLAARYTLGWPQPGAAELAPSQELLTNYRSRQMRRRISSPSPQESPLWGWQGAWACVPGSFVTLLPLRAGTEVDKSSSMKESSLYV